MRTPQKTWVTRWMVFVGILCSPRNKAAAGLSMKLPRAVRTSRCESSSGMFCGRWRRGNPFAKGVDAAVARRVAGVLQQSPTSTTTSRRIHFCSMVRAMIFSRFAGILVGDEASTSVGVGWMPIKSPSFGEETFVVRDLEARCAGRSAWRSRRGRRYVLRHGRGFKALSAANDEIGHGENAFIAPLRWQSRPRRWTLTGQMSSTLATRSMFTLKMPVRETSRTEPSLILGDELEPAVSTAGD